jgi:hypothetical protein
MTDEKAAQRRGSRADRIEGLRRRGEFERDTLAREIAGLRGAIDEKKARWKTIGWVAGIAAAAGTVGYKLFGKNSLSAKIGRMTSAAQILFGLGRAVGKTRKFW